MNDAPGRPPILLMGVLPLLSSTAWSHESVTTASASNIISPEQLVVIVPIAALIVICTIILYYTNRLLRRENIERQRIEQQLKNSNNTLCETQEIAHVGNWEWNIVTGELAWSDEIYRIFGLQPRQFSATYEAFLERVHPADREVVTSAVTESVSHDSPYEVVHRIVRPTGEQRIVNERGRVYRDTEGKPLRMLGVVHDITQIKAVEESLRRERDTAQRYLDIAGVMLLILNREGLITLINRHGLQLLGYDAEQQVLGKNWFSHFLPEPMSNDLQSVYSHIISGELPVIDKYINQIIDRHGTKRLISWQNSLLHDDEGRISGILSSGQDITQQRETEERLRLTDKVFEFSSEAILITDHENRIVAANPGFIKQTGFTLEDVIGNDPKMFRSGRHDRAFYEQMWKGINEEGHWAGEVWDRRKDGNIYPKWVTINVVRDTQTHGIIHYIAIFSDLTQRKAVEEEIRYLAHHDPLTELPNRLLLEDRISQAIAKAYRNDHHVAVLFIDLDRFKPINDTFGHHIGDLLLQEIAHRLAGCVRDSDTVGRLGGDEFVIVLDGLEYAHDIQRVAMLAAAEIGRDIIIEGHSLSVTASIGISLYPYDGKDPATLLQHADSAMYQAKKSPAQSCCYFSSAHHLMKRDADTP